MAVDELLAYLISLQLLPVIILFIRYLQMDWLWPRVLSSKENSIVHRSLLGLNFGLANKSGCQLKALSRQQACGYLRSSLFSMYIRRRHNCSKVGVTREHGANVYLCIYLYSIGKILSQWLLINFTWKSVDFAAHNMIIILFWCIQHSALDWSTRIIRLIWQVTYNQKSL